MTVSGPVSSLRGARTPPNAGISGARRGDIDGMARTTVLIVHCHVTPDRQSRQFGIQYANGYKIEACGLRHLIM
jgi:hypothetical protein